MLVQFDRTMSGISKENRRHEPWTLVGHVWACYRARRIRNGQIAARSSTDIEDGSLSELWRHFGAHPQSEPTSFGRSAVAGAARPHQAVGAPVPLRRGRGPADGFPRTPCS